MHIIRTIFIIFVSLLLWVGNAFSQSQNKSLKILLISDLNSSYGATHYGKEVHEVIAKIDAVRPDLILVAGDMVAGQKASLTREQTQAMWDAFDEQIFQKIENSKIPFAFTLGNHDASPSFLQDRALASAYWNNKKAAMNLNMVDDTHFPYYYSFEQNGVFIASWDASAAVVKEDVYKWLEAQLESPRAKQSRMRILLGHLPLYAIVASKNKVGEVNANPTFAMDFFEKHQVNMYISGHQHAYYPAQQSNVVLLNAGAIGDGPRPIMGHDAEAMRAYSILEIRKRPKKFALKTWNPETNKRIEHHKLPDSVRGFNGTVYKKKDL